MENWLLKAFLFFFKFFDEDVEVHEWDEEILFNWNNNK